MISLFDSTGQPLDAISCIRVSTTKVHAIGLDGVEYKILEIEYDGGYSVHVVCDTTPGQIEVTIEHFYIDLPFYTLKDARCDLYRPTEWRSSLQHLVILNKTDDGLKRWETLLHLERKGDVVRVAFGEHSSSYTKEIAALS